MGMKGGTMGMKGGFHGHERGRSMGADLRNSPQATGTTEAPGVPPAHLLAASMNPFSMPGMNPEGMACPTIWLSKMNSVGRFCVSSSASRGSMNLPHPTAKGADRRLKPHHSQRGRQKTQTTPQPGVRHNKQNTGPGQSVMHNTLPRPGSRVHHLQQFQTQHRMKALCQNSPLFPGKVTGTVGVWCAPGCAVGSPHDSPVCPCPPLCFLCV